MCLPGLLENLGGKLEAVIGIMGFTFTDMASVVLGHISSLSILLASITCLSRQHSPGDSWSAYFLII